MTQDGQIILIVSVTAAAVSDLCVGRIYNFIVVPALAAGIGIVLFEAPHSLPAILAAVILTFVLLYPFWRAGGLGAGDIKLFAAVIPYLGVSWYLVCFALSFLIAALFSLGLLIVCRDLSRRIHLAVPVGISVMLCLLLRQLGIQSPFRFFI